MTKPLEGRIQDYAERLLKMILSRGNHLPRTYGFEYEFLPHRILHRRDKEALDRYLVGRGYCWKDGTYESGWKRVVFEPGGQIEYLSPPLRESQEGELKRVLDWIRSTNADILSELGIEYLGKGFLPGRYDAPLLLEAPRYRKMHSRFMQVDRRGPDMMKGTAAIHLHAAVTTRDEIGAMYARFCTMARSRELGMSPERRSIWDCTDSCRCGLICAEAGSDPMDVLRCIVESTLKAVELNSGQVFQEMENTDFNDFLVHLTTMFTDVRINVKGGTVELRTPDSRPVEQFPSLWRSFLGGCCPSMT